MLLDTAGGFMVTGLVYPEIVPQPVEDAIKIVKISKTMQF